MGKQSCLPPRRFKAAGAVEWVQHSQTTPSFIRETRQRGRRAQGLRYQEKVSSHLNDRFGEVFVSGPWFRYKAVGVDKPRWCQPDGLLFIPELSRIILIEVKLQHTSDAWWQLRQLYLPVVAHAFPPSRWEYVLCEVVRWYDPIVAFPEKVRLRPDVLSAEPGEFACHIWK